MKKILIVEDETLIALDLKDRLDRQGYQVLPVARSAEAAIDRALKERPDIILMDVILKGEKNGIDAACAIVETYAVPILFVTGNAHFCDDERIRRIPVHGILGKPPVERTLMNTIDEMLKAN